MKRKQVYKETEKSYVEFMQGGVSKGKHIYEKNDTIEIQKIQQEALSKGYDVLSCNHSISLSPKQWYDYWCGRSISIVEGNIYEMDTVFCDIDSGLLENWNQYSKAIKGLKIQSYKTYESVSGKIHLYIGIKKTTDKKLYKEVCTDLARYFQEFGLKMDNSCTSPSQKVYMEGIRVLSKVNDTIPSECINKLSKNGSVQSLSQIRKTLHGGFYGGIKRSMYAIRDEIIQGVTRLESKAMSRKYGISQSNYSRALNRLVEAQAVQLVVKTGRGGYAEVVGYNMDLINDCIGKQLTGKQNNHNYIIRGIGMFFNLRLFYTLNIINKLCNEVLRMLGTYCPGITDSTSRDATEASKRYGLNQTGIKIPPSIDVGERNERLWKLLLHGKYRGLGVEQLRELAQELHNRMENQWSFKQSEVNAVLRWVNKQVLKF